MQWLRHNYLAVIVLIAILGSFIANDAQSSERDGTQHRQLVDTCVRGSAKSALLASYQHRTADARRAKGDVDIADDYDGYAMSNIDLIPVPDGIRVGDPSIAATTRRPLPGGKFKFVLTSQAVDLQKAGCERANAR